MSPGQRKSPAGEPGSLKVIAATCTDDTPSVAASQQFRPRLRPHPARCSHGTPTGRHCWRCLRGRRAVGRELSALCRRLSPDAPATGPSTFGLDPDALRELANALHREGWGLDEIAATLAVEPRRTA